MKFEQFCKLPKEILNRKDLSSSDKIVFSVLANYQGENEHCWPGIKRLAHDTGLARQTVMDSISRLEQAELLHVKRQGRGKSNLYITGLNSRPVEDLNRSENQTTGGLKIRPEVVQKLDPKRIKKRTIEKTYNSSSTAYKLSLFLMNLILEQKSDFSYGRIEIREQTLQRWSVDMDRMLQIDGRCPEQIEAVIRWARADPFWSANILSADSLRRRFDTLELQSQRTKLQVQQKRKARDYTVHDPNIMMI